MIGSRLPDFGPMGQLGGHVRRSPLPALAPAAWSFLEHADEFGRWPMEADEAADGDVVVAGVIYTEDVQVDSGGYLWVARFTPDGAQVWSQEYPDERTGVTDIEVLPTDEIAVVGNSIGLGDDTSVRLLDAEG